jgi:hypothetical protein
MMKSRRKIWAVHVACWKLLKKAVTQETKLRLESQDKSKIDLKQIGWEIVDWIHLAQDRDHWRFFVNTVMKLLFA